MDKQANPNLLPPKEVSIFKRIVKYYDQKQYKNGLKFTKQILGNPKFAEHGETLAMKGILLNCLGKKEEAREYVKRGLKANISSFVCWHIYGLIQKSDRKYDEAIKCYLQALRLDPENLQVLRDLSVLQMQLRNYEGCKDTRYKLLMLRPSQRASWIGYALIHHLLGNYDTALMVLNEFRKGQGEPGAGYETSELLLYQAMVLTEAGKHETALKHLEDSANEIVDKTSLLEMKAQLLLSTGNLSDAKECIWKLVDRNPENHLYLDLLCKASGCTDTESAEGKSVCKVTFDEVLAKYPRSRLARRLLLDLYSGEEFVNHLDVYLRYHLRRGAPPLFVQLMGLWSNDEKFKTLGQLLTKYRDTMSLCHSLHSPDDPEPPSTDIWLNFLQAQFLNHKGQYQDALDVIDSQLLSTPTLVDFYVLKADVYNAAGDVITASRWMEEAQSLDTADRYINARCTNLMVQAHRLTDAVSMASKFTRGNTSAADYLSEMQCMWFLIENARALKTMGKFGEALKLCHEIEQHYRNILDDQLDFHSYCLRKGTLRAYIETLRLEDRLRDHPSYFEAAQLAVEIYLHLAVRPLGAETDRSAGEQDLSTPEAKKMRNKQRKAARRAEAEAARARAEQERREQAIRSRQPATDEADPDRAVTTDSGLDPQVLARPTDPLEEACKFLRPLLDLAPKRIELHCLAYEVYEHKKKLLLMLRSIKHGSRIPGSADHPWFHECCVRFLVQLDLYAETFNKAPDSYVHKVLSTEVPLLFPGWPTAAKSMPSAFNEAFQKRNATSYSHVFRATLLRCLTNPGERKTHLSQLPLPADGSFNPSWKVCADALNLLKAAYTTSLGEVDASVIENYRTLCAQQFPMANAFKTDSELEDLRTKAVEEANATAVCGLYTSYTGTDLKEHTYDVVPDSTGVVEPLKKMQLGDAQLVNGEMSGDASDPDCPCEAPSVKSSKGNVSALKSLSGQTTSAL
ncbi:N-alpha-acetyltransferase 15, NatA auxiliary subunit [Clonorchis sinensis]|uniref:N-alpha-acetyltransferase 15, NatA auxiliary subunit n=1 Tax=Clonorchis sinensis TaxID=79923 RepID=A0A8T1MK63_CLOSI|nr:N-alpha-acetyltransferase 15, NatA auxiliary subunit [Clonorchis sinensis]